MSNGAWVTLATNDSYGLGALVLAHSLRRVNSVYSAVVLITPSVTDAMRNRLSAVFSEVIVVDVLDSRDATHLALLQRPELGITFTKIHCWSLTQYEKCVFLDADALIVQNCDELFEREELSAAPDVGWPDCFNSGVFVYKPSQETFDALIKFAKERGSFDGGDQGLLNAFFSDWAHGDINKHLPFLYNVTSAAFYSYLPALKHYGANLKIIHFIGATKPWLQTYNWESHSVDAPGHLQESLQLWWNIFVSAVHPQLDLTMAEAEEPLQSETAELPDPVPDDVVTYYVPAIDPTSEFPWHRSDNTQIEAEKEQYRFDASSFFDPWERYGGTIPANQNVIPQCDSEGLTEVTQEFRDYVWNYVPMQHKHEPMSSHVHYADHSLPKQISSERPHQYHIHGGDDHRDFQQSHDNHDHHKHQYVQHDGHQDHQYFLTPNNHHHHHQDQYNRREDNQSWISDKQVKSHDHSIDNYSIENHNVHSQVNNHHVQQSYHIHVDNDSIKKRKKRHSKKLSKRLNQIDMYGDLDNITNGYLSGSDSDVSDEIRVRHPYDGFYLRHTITVDSRGYKVCSHQVPPTPPSTPPPESPPGIIVLEQEEEDKEINVKTVMEYSGVAGNLARVVPGAPTQRDAIDELTRRQGWEAGNIDYMGADSFDNIWAKISQTLNQSPKQPTPPPKEPSPPKQPSPPKEQPVVPQPEPSPPKQPAPTTPVASVQSVPIQSDVPKTTELPVSKEETKSVVVVSETVKQPAPVETTKVEEKPKLPAVTSAPVSPSKSEPETVTPVSGASAKSTEEKLEEQKTPEKSLEASVTSTDSPPLANTPSKEDIPPVPKSAEQGTRRPGGCLCLNPPASRDAPATPDSEIEDAAALAMSIIASELAPKEPAVTAATPTSPQSPAVIPSTERLSAAVVALPTPPAGPVSLAQIGVKTKPSTASQIESSLVQQPAEVDVVSPTEAPKKKLVKKVVKKDAPSPAGDAPVPPPRKKEKKPKDK